MFENSLATMGLFDGVVRLRTDGTAAPAGRAALATAEAGEWAVAAFHAADDSALHSDLWERHPAGDELLCVLSGAVRLYLGDHRAGTESAAVVTAGRTVVVPAGTWHRLSVVEPADLLAVTPPLGTSHEYGMTPNRDDAKE